MKKISELKLDQANVILRVDYNLPINPEGKIIDDSRIRATLKTIRYLLDRKCRIILLSHLGRPEGVDPNLSLKKVIPILESLIGQKVFFEDDFSKAQSLISTLPKPSILLLENLRFHKEEESPNLNPSFAKQLAALGDFYINDAFACAHREHSSITEIPKFFSGRSAAGFLMDEEIKQLRSVLTPKHPFYLMLGGSKISTKLGIINSLLPKADALFIGGAMAFPFMKAQGISCGNTKIDDDQIRQAEKILEITKKTNKPVYLPKDWKCKENIKDAAAFTTFTAQDGIPPNYQAFDIGDATIEDWSKKLELAATIFWNGPLGMYEVPPFDSGTAEIAKFIASLNCISIAGGGDSIAAIEKLHLKKGFTHLSTGGGASLEFLEKGSLPGINSLN